MAYNDTKPKFNDKPKVEAPRELPVGYLQNGYMTVIEGNKRISSDYIVKHAVTLANGFKAGEMARTQLYKFYSEVVSVSDQIRNGYINIQKAQEELEMLLSKATNSRTKGVASELFYKFIQANVKASKTKEDINAFKRHFEAIMGFFPAK